jgi:hypothetical protein
MTVKKKRVYKSRATLTPAQLKEAHRRGGRKGGRSKSVKKQRASRRVLRERALPGRALAKLRRDVEAKLLANRREWATSIADERVTLDVKFEKLLKVLEQMEKPGKNGA